MSSIKVFLFLFFQYGLYASIVPGFIYAVFGTCKEATIGPTAVNALVKGEKSMVDRLMTSNPIISRCHTTMPDLLWSRP